MKAITLSLSAALLAMLFVCTTAWSATGDKNKPVFAYSAETNRYLVVYEKDVGGTSTNIDVYGQLVAADGTAHGAEFAISGATNVQIVPQVAYDSANQRFLVVWQDRSIDSNYDIHGQLINAGGSLFGSAIVVANTPLQELNPSVAYDPVNHKFLVAWERTRVVGGLSTSYWDVYGQLVDVSGALSGSNFAIAEDDSYMGSRIAFDPANQRFLVAYLGVVAGPTFDIFGRLVNSDGSLFGAAGFAISTVDDSNQYLKSVVHDPVNNRFLVSWEDDRVDSYSNHDIYGQLVNSDGMLNGSEMPLSTVANHQSFPAAAFGGSGQRFLVIWHDRRSGTDADIYGQYLNPDGSLYNTDSLTNVPLVAASGNQLFPSIAYNSACSNFMVAYEDRSVSPIAIRYDLIGAPCAADTTPPAVVSQTPAINATGIADHTVITATFSEAMDALTINATNFTLNGGITGTVTYDAGSKTATLTPSSNLSYSTTYTASVTAGVKDLAGNTLAADYTWSFTTETDPDTTPPQQPPPLPAEHTPPHRV